MLLKKIICPTAAAALALGMLLQSAIGVFGSLSPDSAGGYMNRGVSEERVRITEGPLAGIYASETEAGYYDDLMSDLKNTDALTDGRILVMDLNPVCSLALDSRPGTFTTWFISNELYMFDDYFASEEHIPAYAYIPYKRFYYGCGANKSALAYERVLDKYFTYTKREGKGGTIYELTAAAKE